MAAQGYTIGSLQTFKLASVIANDTAVLPIGFRIDSIDIRNNTANAITGGMRIGTTDTGIDVAVAVAVGANVLVLVPDTTILKRLFSTTTTQTLFLQAVVSWNSASLDIWINGRIVP